MNSFSSRIRRYKQLLLFYLTLNFFLLFTGLALVAKFWKDQHLGRQQVKSNFNDLTKLQESLEMAKLLISTPKARNETQLFRTWQSLTRLRENLSQIDPALSDSLFPDDGILRGDISQLETRLLTEIKTRTAKSEKILSSLWKVQAYAAAVGILTFIFGVILPVFIVKRLFAALSRLKAELVRDAREWLERYLSKQMEFGPDAVKRTEFWIEVFLLSFEQFGRYSNHPLVQFGSELCLILRKDHPTGSVEKIRKLQV